MTFNLNVLPPATPLAPLAGPLASRGGAWWLWRLASFGCRYFLHRRKRRFADLVADLLMMYGTKYYFRIDYRCRYTTLEISFRTTYFEVLVLCKNGLWVCFRATSYSCFSTSRTDVIIFIRVSYQSMMVSKMQLTV